MTTVPEVGGYYNWIGQPEHLVFMGTATYPCDRRLWWQFAKVETPNECWSEVLTKDLLLFEETKGQP